MHRRQAFTLIEVSIAVFILAMLIAVSAPAFVRSYNDILLRETGRTFATMCQYGRIQAVQRQAKAVLHIDLDKQVFWLSQGVEDGESSTLKAYPMPDRVRLAAAERHDQPGGGERLVEINFYPNGTCDGVSVVFRGSGNFGVAATVDPITCKAMPYSVKP